MGTPRSAILATQPASVAADKAIVIKGIKFQSEHLTQPDKWCTNINCVGDDPSVNQEGFLLTIWEALVILPLIQGGNAPEYLPVLSSTLQQGDTADRVLWKRITHLPCWGNGVFGSSGFQQLSSTIRDSTHTAIEVKTRARLDDRHGLYFVRNFVHDLFFTTTNSTTCTGACNCPAPPGNSNEIPIEHDFWAKVFWTTTRR